MLVCPNCSSPMKGYSTVRGDVYVCQRCGGRTVPLASLQREGAPRRVREFTGALFKQLKSEPRKVGPACPHCGQAMWTTHTPGRAPQLRIDVCPKDGFVFFDPKTYGAMYPDSESQAAFQRRRAEESEPIPLEGSDDASDESGLTILDDLSRTPGSRSVPPRPQPGGAIPPVHRPGGPVMYPMQPPPPRRPAPTMIASAGEESMISLAMPESGWQYIPALLGFPVEMSERQTSRKPLVTYGLAAILVAVFMALWIGGTLNAAIEAWGFIPAEWQRHNGLTLLTSFFLHAGLFHLASNVYFLMIFGDNVEDQLGGLWYVLLLLGATLAGNAAHAVFDPAHASEVAVGASGGIAGVIAYYAIAFPRAKIGILPSYIFLFFGMIRMPAFVALLLFVALQIVQAYMQTHGLSNVSGLAHLGGLAVGVAAGIAARVMGPKIKDLRAN